MPSILNYSLEIKPYVGDRDESLVMLLARWVESAAKQFVRHGIIQQTYENELQPKTDTGFFDNSDLVNIEGDRVFVGGYHGVRDGHVLQLDNGFVRSISDLREDHSARFGQGSDDFPEARKLTQGVDFALETDEPGLSKSGRVIKRNGQWSPRAGTIRVTYIAGLTHQELDDRYSFVKPALLGEIQMRLQSVRSLKGMGGGPLKKEVYHGDVTFEYDTSQTLRQLGSLSVATRSQLEPLVTWRL